MEAAAQKGRGIMPYCPKCDMEFVDGVTECTDCHGPLVESREAAEAMKQAEQAKKEEEMRLRYEEAMKAEDTEGSDKTQDQKPEAAKAYVNKEQRYEDMNSSAFAFFLIGGALAAATILILAGVIRLPMAGFSKYVFYGLLIFMTVGSFLIALSSKKSARVLKTEAADEEKETEEILQWFVKTYSGSDLDDQIRMEEETLSDEELSLKRFELIQDYLITGRDLPDQSYVDALCEMIYSRLYGSN